MNVFPGEITQSLARECPEWLLVTLQMTMIIVHLHQDRTTPHSPRNLTRAGHNEGFFLTVGRAGGWPRSQPPSYRSEADFNCEALSCPQSPSAANRVCFCGIHWSTELVRGVTTSTRSGRHRTLSMLGTGACGWLLLNGSFLTFSTPGRLLPKLEGINWAVPSSQSCRYSALSAGPRTRQR